MEIFGNYLVDIVFCFDGCMRSKDMILQFQKIAKEFPSDFNNKMLSKGKNPLITRAKVLSIRNENDKMIFLESPFYDLAEKWKVINTLIDEIRSNSFVQESHPIDELWLISKAILSEWNEVKEINKKRQVILYFKDNSQVELDLETERFRFLFEHTSKIWDDSNAIDQFAKRMIMFAPEIIPFSKISDEWENSIHYPINQDFRMSEVDYQTIIKSVVIAV